MSSYGDAKRRDIARSVLPSTRRRSARADKRHVHHAVRARVRGMLAHGDWDADLVLDAQRYGSYRGIKTVVWERRAADKLGPLVRWAEAKADSLGDTPEERWTALRAILPDGLIGSHAMSHVEHLDAYDTNPWRYRWPRRSPGMSYVERRRQLVAALDARIVRHGELNATLKEHGHADRLWLGRHDTPAFVAWVLHQPLELQRHIGEERGWSWLNVGARQIVTEFCGFDNEF